MIDPHDDFLGQRIQVGDVVAGYNGFNSMALYTVTRVNPKMIKVKLLKYHNNPEKLSKAIYGKMLIKVDEELVTVHLLKNGITI